MRRRVRTRLPAPPALSSIPSPSKISSVRTPCARKLRLFNTRQIQIRIDARMVDLTLQIACARVWCMSVPHLSSKPDVLGGEPCFDGTSVPVDALFVNLAAGERLDVILSSYPAITREAAVGLLREACRLIRERALQGAPLSSETRAQIRPLMHPHDWDALAVDERAAYYQRR